MTVIVSYCNVLRAWISII